MFLVSNHVNKGLIWRINYLYCVCYNCILTQYSTLHSKAQPSAMCVVVNVCKCVQILVVLYFHMCV